MSQDYWEQGRAYVEKQRKAGRTNEEIRQGLLKAGWQEAQVAKLLPPEQPAPTASGWVLPSSADEPSTKPPPPATPHVRHATRGRTPPPSRRPRRG